MPEYHEFLDLAERYERVMLDTTMAFTAFAEAGAPFPRDALPRLGTAWLRAVCHDNAARLFAL